MENQPAFSPVELFDHIAGDVARSICERPGETSQQRAVRYQATVEMVRAFHPGDVIETMLAGHCVTLHAVIVDCGHDLSRDQEDAMRRATRSHFVALNGGFLRNLDRLALCRRRVDEVRREVPKVRRDVAEVPRDVVVERRGEIDVPRDVAERPVEAPIETVSADPTPAPAMNRAARRQMARAARRTGQPVAAKARDVLARLPPLDDASLQRPVSLDIPVGMATPEAEAVQVPTSRDAEPVLMALAGVL
jgi:hypothetical protein